MHQSEIISPVRQRRLRRGYTTGSCATAAAAAATQSLLTQERPSEATIHLPAGMDVAFRVESWKSGADWVRCSVIKDAGDDPDVTHLAEIVATVSLTESTGLELTGGEGVGAVTRPGLGLPIGGPAINPVPRRMICEHVGAIAAALGDERGLRVEISVPRGEELARRTLNGRLGILGGLSILGTSGLVIPYSTAAWRASVEQAIDVAVANGQRHLALTTGSRSEKFAQALLPLPEIAFVEMGEFTGQAIRRSVRRGAHRVTLCGMVGKLSKIAQGHLMTHVAANQVDPLFLAQIAEDSGASPNLAAAIRGANTARHFQELVIDAGLGSAFDRLVQLVVEQCHAAAGGQLDVDCVLFDFDGRVLGRAASRGTT